MNFERLGVFFSTFFLFSATFFAGELGANFAEIPPRDSPSCPAFLWRSATPPVLFGPLLFPYPTLATVM
jgi:hypothetical protein